MKHISQIGLAIATTALVSLTGCDDQSEVVGPRGGTVISEDGRFMLSIPEGALPDDVEFSVVAIDCDQHDAVGDCYTVEPMGTSFLLPVEVSYEVADMELGSVDTEDLAVVVERGSDWSMLADRDVDTEDEVVYASATYSSSFALIPLR